MALVVSGNPFARLLLGMISAGDFAVIGALALLIFEVRRFAPSRRLRQFVARTTPHEPGFAPGPMLRPEPVARQEGVRTTETRSAGRADDPPTRRSYTHALFLLVTALFIIALLARRQGSRRAAHPAQLTRGMPPALPV
jgi:hypothetical protein